MDPLTLQCAPSSPVYAVPYDTVFVACGPEVMAALRRLGLRHTDIAARLGVSRCTVTQWAHNTRKIARKYHRALTDMLGEDVVRALTDAMYGEIRTRLAQEYARYAEVLFWCSTQDLRTLSDDELVAMDRAVLGMLRIVRALGRMSRGATRAVSPAALHRGA